MKRTAYTAMMLLVAVLASEACGRMEPAEPVAQPLNLTQAALFKNGFGFFVGQVAFPADKTALRFLLPAVPSQGTFWLSYPPEIKLTSVVARKARSQGESREAITIPEILKANVGRQVRITIGEKQISGRITYVTEDHRMLRPLTDTLPAPQVDDEQRAIWPPFDQGLVILDAEGGTVSLDPRSVEQVLFPEGRVQRSFARTTEAVEVRVQTDKPLKGQSLTVSFLAKGIAWTPSYLVDISNEKQAQFSAQALVVNEVYDLNDVPSQLVTGFPRMQFADMLSPIGMKQPLAQFLQALVGQERKAVQVPGVPYMMARGAEVAGQFAADVTPSYGQAEAGAAAEDLFLYPAGRITLARDRVAYLPLFTETVPYEHLYQWDIPDSVDEIGQFRPAEIVPSGGEKQQEVWHSLRLTNTTKVPWTPAAAEAMEDSMILGQDTIEYTPAGDKATLRIARTADVKVEQRESELERQREAQQFYGASYDLVAIRGELSITNFRKESITLEITKHLSGEVVSTEPQAKIEQPATGLKRMNPAHKLTWTIEIPPSEKQLVTYIHRLYLRR